MNISFYKKEVASLQALFEKFNNIKFTSDPNEGNPSKQKQNNKILADMVDSDLLSKGGLIIGISLILLILGMVAFLTIWLVN